MSLDRRALLRHAAGLGAMTLIPAPLLGLARCSVRRDGARPDVRPHAGVGEGGYGDLVPSRECPELALPPNFSVVRLSVSGARMSDGVATPGAFDGMAAFPLPNGHIRLVRNHEIFTPRLLGDVAKAYDAMGGGGTTSLEVRVGGDGSVQKVRDFVSLGGTIVNCAGGPTPWGTWLSCEETVDGQRAGWQRAHGYVFEVPVDAEVQAEARPLPAMGRFVHEAVAVDPATGVVYLTEDMTVDPARDRLGAGFYRFVPRVRTQLSEGGRLQALGVEGRRATRPITVSTWARRCPPCGWMCRRPIRPMPRPTCRRSCARPWPRAPRSSRDSRGAGTGSAACSSPPPAAGMPGAARSGSTARATVIGAS
jgi:secreted PhoX family phosphatase